VKSGFIIILELDLLHPASNRITAFSFTFNLNSSY
jgi:hypothetical protein